MGGEQKTARRHPVSPDPTGAAISALMAEVALPWTGLHRHALMSCVAFAYLQHLRLAGHRSTGPGKNAAPGSGTAAVAEPARRAPGHRRAAVRAPRRAGSMSALHAAVPAAS